MVGMDEDGEPKEAFHMDAMFAPDVDRNLRHLPPLVVGAVRTVWAAAKRPLIGMVVLQVAASIALAAQVVIIKGLLSALLSAQKTHHFGNATPWLIALAGILIIVGVASIAQVEMQRLLSELVGRYCIRKVIATSTAIDLVAYDNPTFHDRLQRATVNASIRPLEMTTGLLTLGSSVASSVGIGAVLLFIQPLFLVLIVVAAIPLSLASVIVGRAIYQFEVDQTPGTRQRYYLQSLLTEKDPAKEVRAYGLAPFLQGWFDELYDERVGALRSLVRRRLRTGLGGGLLTGIISSGVLALLIVLVANGDDSLASAGTAAVALLLLGSQLQTMATGIGELFESSLFLRDFASFTALLDGRPEKVLTDHVPDEPAEIVASQLTFTYPSRTEPTLRGVSLDLAPGQVVALVGANGSGKTTLAKLLAGLYRPNSGSLRWGDVDTADVPADELRDRTTILFQDFMRYYLSAADNITMGRAEHRQDLEAMRLAAERAGIADDVARLPNGYETSLSPQFFGGSDLSGGQWQRLALARAFFRDAQLVILDEPTAALDPRAEAALFSSIRGLFQGRSVVLISHRFASVRMADHIYVLEEGTVLEHGTHDELMVLKGRYAELFTLQAAAYGLDEATPPAGDR